MDSITVRTVRMLNLLRLKHLQESVLIILLQHTNESLRNLLRQFTIADKILRSHIYFMNAKSFRIFENSVAERLTLLTS